VLVKVSLANLHCHSRPLHNAPFTQNSLFLRLCSPFSYFSATLHTSHFDLHHLRNAVLKVRSHVCSPHSRLVLLTVSHAPARRFSALRRLLVSLCLCACSLQWKVSCAPARRISAARCFLRARSPPFHPFACIPSPTHPLAAFLLLAVSRTPTRLSALHHSLFPCPTSLTSLTRSPPRASSSASHLPSALCFPSASLDFTWLGLAALSFASPAKPSQAPNVIKTGYRMSMVWIWSSENGRQGGIGQPSQEWYRYDEERNSVKEE
jgi:hypothetical protein